MMMEKIKKSEFENTEISINEDNYIINHNDNYFKMGLAEGQLFEALYSGKDFDYILNTYNITEEDLSRFIGILRKNNIIGAPRKRKKNIFFYKIPLINADTLMNKITSFIKKNSKLFKILLFMYNLIIIVGLLYFILNLSSIFKLDSVTLPIGQYILLYVLMLLSVILHEFSHGITCKLFGGKVGTMGFMLIFFSPAFYCDISGIRMINDKRKQIFTSFAGIYFNIFLVALSAILYMIAKKPLFASFLLLNLVMILSNIVPLIKLDGYWMLSFATGITNLYSKSIKGINLIWKGKSREEKFIGWYGLVTIVFAVTSILSLLEGLFLFVNKIVKFLLT